MLLWPRKGEPVIVANKIAAGLAERDGWIDKIALYEAYVDSPYTKLAEVLRDTGLSKAGIGFEKDYISVEHWESIAREAPGLTMVDCTKLMDRVRWIKTDEGVAPSVAPPTFSTTPTSRCSGASARRHRAQSACRHDRLCLRLGFEWAHGILNTFKNTVPYGGESDVVIETGDAIRTDYVSYLLSYPGHQSRTVIVGEPTRRSVATMQSIWKCTARPSTAAAPGRACTSSGAVAWTSTGSTAGPTTTC